MEVIGLILGLSVCIALGVYFSRLERKCFSTSEELRRCPFCGCTAHYAHYHYKGFGNTHIVRCNGCDAETHEYYTAEEAANAWNMRCEEVER